MYEHKVESDFDCSYSGIFWKDTSEVEKNLHRKEVESDNVVEGVKTNRVGLVGYPLYLSEVRVSYLLLN